MAATFWGINMIVPTLLDMINACLIDMGRPAVDVVGGSVDAQKVEQVYKQTYLSLISRKLWPYRKELISLESLSDTTRPCMMRIPENVERVEEILYGYEQKKLLDYVEPEEFLLRHLSDGTDKIGMSVGSGGHVYVNTNGAPSYWTTFDDTHVVFNSYDASKESTMNKANCTVVGYVIPSWPTSAEERVDIPSRHFGMYDSLARAACHEKIRKEPSPVDSYWGNSLYGRLLHESRKAGTQKGARTRYGRR